MLLAGITELSRSMTLTAGSNKPMCQTNDTFGTRPLHYVIWWKTVFSSGSNPIATQIAVTTAKAKTPPIRLYSR